MTKTPRLQGDSSTRQAGNSRRRDPEGTKAAILEAAVREFSQKGHAGARIDEIAERACINKRMLYHYFGDKDGLYLAVLEAQYQAIRDAENELLLDALDPFDALEALVRFTWDYYRRHPEFLSLLATENVNHATHLARSERIRSLNSPLIERLGRLLLRGEQSGAFRQGTDAFRLYVTIASLCYFYLANRWTLSVSFGRDVSSEAEMEAWLAHVGKTIAACLRP